MVVVPTIFSSSARVRESLETIEAHYLANQDRNIFFALLGDWKAAPREEMPDDSALLAAAVKGIKELNARYNEGPQDRFHLFHRHRLWNQSEGEWVGWEKKRGKLREFNRLLRGARDTSYTTCTADPTFLKRVRYVISLDSDTELPRDAARKLVGTILHPLNRPRLDADIDCVTRGYGILQPLVSRQPPKARRSRIPQILSGYVGINPYTNPVAAAAPNVYQDLFGEGNYVGKALYDVDTFEAALTDRVPENSVLSHDLLEGLYARTALVTDVEIFDHSPSHYVVNSRRNHRWTRGDWQLLPWLLPRVRDARGHHARNMLPVIGRWKIIDNLRRSLIKPAILLWLVAAWTMLPGAPASWTVLILFVFAGPVYLDCTIKLLIQLGRNPEAALRANAWALVKISTGAALSSTVYLAHQAYLMIDAIMRTLYRMFISRRHLLDWVTAARIHQESTLSLRLFVLYMWPASVGALVGLALLAINGAPALVPAAPLLLAWFASPWFACWMSRRMQMESDSLEEDVEMDARLNARWTCRFFETSVADTHLLGRHQMAQECVPSLGASPVNLGRLLVWMIAAHELGAIGTLELAERLESTLFAIENLLASRAVRGNSSPADALGTTTPQHVLIGERGNLAGFLRALKQRWIELSSQPLFDEHLVGGLTDTLLLMKNEFLGVRATTPRGQADVILFELYEEIEACLTFLRARREEGHQTTAHWGRLFNTIGQRAAVIEVMLSSFSEKCPAINVDEMRSWVNYLVRQTLELNREVYLFAPWTSVRTAQVSAIIRRQCPPALALWDHIILDLDRSTTISYTSEELDALQVKLARLCRQLEQSLPSDTVDRETALKRCAELRSAIEAATRASTDAKVRYAGLVNRCQLVAQTDFRPLFDEEYRLLTSQFQISMVG
jgi:cyclic beta-1,2-glucan synthetase